MVTTNRVAEESSEDEAATSAPSPPVINAKDMSLTWLNKALDMPQQLLSYQSRSIGTGQVGENVRYQLEWAGSVPPELASVVGKFPALDEQSRETARMTDSYVKEIGFYRDLQSTVQIATPTFHYLSEDRTNNEFTLLMEDIVGAEPGDQLAGCNIDDARTATTELAKLHAPHWGSTSLSTLDWLEEPSQDKCDFLCGLLTAFVSPFCERYHSRLPSSVLDSAEWIAGVAEEWFWKWETPETLVHGDYRLDNLLFSRSGSAPDSQASPLTVVDWQTTNIGHGPSDLAYFVGAGLLAQQRREVETDLVDLYREQLRLLGVSCDPEEVWYDYQLGSASGLIMAIIASQVVGQTERGDEMFCTMAERHSQQIADLELRDLFVA